MSDDIDWRARYFEVMAELKRSQKAVTALEERLEEARADNLRCLKTMGAIREQVRPQ